MANRTNWRNSKNHIYFLRQYLKPSPAPKFDSIDELGETNEAAIRKDFGRVAQGRRREHHISSRPVRRSAAPPCLLLPLRQTKPRPAGQASASRLQLRRAIWIVSSRIDSPHQRTHLEFSHECRRDFRVADQQVLVFQINLLPNDLFPLLVPNLELCPAEPLRSRGAAKFCRFKIRPFDLVKVVYGSKMTTYSEGASA